MSIAICAVCSTQSERVLHHFPARKYPHNTPYLATLYHRDPFWEKGDLEEYCGPKCATAAFTKRIQI
jgi:hypothetical protein